MPRLQPSGLSLLLLQASLRADYERRRSDYATAAQVRADTRAAAAQGAQARPRVGPGCRIPARGSARGESEKSIQASGKVELRTRRQTVLADWLHYDLVTEEVWAKGNVVMRQGVDWIAGPEAKFKRADETGFFHQPEFHIGENASRGEAKELQFVGENHYELKDFRYTTCVAGNDDWYLTSRSRSTWIARAWSGPRATRASSSRARRYSIRRIWISRCRTSASPDFSRRCSARRAAEGSKCRCRIISIWRRTTMRL